MIRSHPHKQRSHAVLYSALGLGSLAVGVRDLHVGGSTGALWFDAAWGAFAILTIGANLWFALGVDRERELRDRASDKNVANRGYKGWNQSNRRAVRG